MKRLLSISTVSKVGISLKETYLEKNFETSILLDIANTLKSTTNHSWSNLKEQEALKKYKEEQILTLFPKGFEEGGATSVLHITVFDSDAGGSGRWFVYSSMRQKTFASERKSTANKIFSDIFKL